MKLANKFKHDFTKGLFELYDKNANVVFREDLYKSWERYERNENGNVTFWEDSDGDTDGTPKNKISITDPNSIAQFFNHDFNKGVFKLYNKNGNSIFIEESNGFWDKYELDENGDILFWEDSDGDTDGTPRQKETEGGKKESELDKMIEYNKKIGEFLNNLKN